MGDEVKPDVKPDTTPVVTPPAPKPAESDFYTFWESLAWHFKSRRSRLILGGLLAIILVQTRPWGITEDQANKMAEYIMYLVGALVAALTGERFVPNGRAVPNPENDELLKRLDEALAKLEEKENGQQ
jgi:hypothetical protein